MPFIVMPADEGVDKHPNDPNHIVFFRGMLAANECYDLISEYNKRGITVHLWEPPANFYNREENLHLDPKPEESYPPSYEASIQLALNDILKELPLEENADYHVHGYSEGGARAEIFGLALKAAIEATALRVKPLVHVTVFDSASPPQLIADLQSKSSDVTQQTIDIVNAAAESLFLNPKKFTAAEFKNVHQLPVLAINPCKYGTEMEIVTRVGRIAEIIKKANSTKHVMLKSAYEGRMMHVEHTISTLAEHKFSYTAKLDSLAIFTSTDTRNKYQGKHDEGRSGYTKPLRFESRELPPHIDHQSCMSVAFAPVLAELALPSFKHKIAAVQLTRQASGHLEEESKEGLSSARSSSSDPLSPHGSSNSEFSDSDDAGIESDATVTPSASDTDSPTPSQSPVLGPNKAPINVGSPMSLDAVCLSPIQSLLPKSGRAPVSHNYTLTLSSSMSSIGSDSDDEKTHTSAKDYAARRVNCGQKFPPVQQSRTTPGAIAITTPPPRSHTVRQKSKSQPISRRFAQIAGIELSPSPEALMLTVLQKSGYRS